MKPPEAVACPACEAPNRPTWEFCVRCGESLEGAPLQEEGTARVVLRSADEGTSSAASTGVAVLFLLALSALAVGAWVGPSRAGPDQPDPALFTIGALPSPLPSPPAPAPGSGVEDYVAGRRLLASGEPQEAIPRLAAAVSADPDSAEYRKTYGHALLRTGDLEGALAAHAEAARLDPRLRIHYGRTLEVTGENDRAVQVYEGILAENPAATTVREDLGRLLFRTGAYTEAVPHLQEAVAGRPDDPVLQQELAYTLDQSGDKEGAAAVYRGVLEKSPQAVISRGLLSENLFGQGQTDEALSVLREGLALTPQAPLLHRQMGSLLERSGKKTEATVAYREYARLAPNAPDATSVADRAAALEAAGRRR